MATNSFFKKIMGERARAAASVKLIAVVLSLVASIWLTVSVAGERWVIVTFVYFRYQTWDWGLWNTCHDVEEDLTVCVDTDWLGVCLVFSMIALTFSICATVCGVYGIWCAGTDVRRDTLFKAAVIFLSLVVFVEFVVVILYPVKFRQNILKFESVKRWDFDWSFGFAWGGLIFSLSSALFYCVSGKCVTITIRNETERDTFDNYE